MISLFQSQTTKLQKVLFDMTMAQKQMKRTANKRLAERKYIFDGSNYHSIDKCPKIRRVRSRLKNL